MEGIRPPILGRAAYVPPEKDFTETLFNKFVKAQTLKGTLSSFFTLCEQINVKQFESCHTFYQTLKDKVRSWKATSLWSSLDQLVGKEEYSSGSICAAKKVLIIGAGPCGLRTAIECSLLGAKVVVIEKRENFSRNNVLHLWPFVIKDLRRLGSKLLYPKFCPGNIDHISIRRLQLILLKVCLCLGVEVHSEVTFQDLVEPPEDQTEGVGWRAKLDPEDHPLSKFEFDVVIGADGRRNTLKGFERKKAGRALAIALTFNFKNYNSTAEARVQEIGGIAFQFRQDFFKEMKQKLGIELENLVYYKDETHYFVVTAKKSSLMKKDVIKEDKPTITELLAPSNVDHEKLQAYALEIATFSTNLPKYDFEINHHGLPDVAMFDFTSIQLACHPAFIRNKNGHELLLCLVGDSLLQPFWPQGTGCARGFLSSLDASWMIREWSLGERDPLDILAEREMLYLMLPNTAPMNLSKEVDLYGIRPETRYKLFENQIKVKHEEVKHLYNPDDHVNEERVKRKFDDPWDSVVAQKNMTRSGSREDILSEQSTSDEYLEQCRARNKGIDDNQFWKEQEKDYTLQKNEFADKKMLTLEKNGEQEGIHVGDEEKALQTIGIGSTNKDTIVCTDGGDSSSLVEESGSKDKEVNGIYSGEEEKDICVEKTGSTDQKVNNFPDDIGEGEGEVVMQSSGSVSEEVDGFQVRADKEKSNTLVEKTGLTDQNVSIIQPVAREEKCYASQRDGESTNEKVKDIYVGTEEEKENGEVEATE